MKCLKARFGLAKAFVLAVAFALVCVCGLAGCSQQATSESGSGLVKSEDYPNTVTVDKLSMEYPNEFEVSKKYDAGQHAGDFPDGVSDTASALLLNKSGSIMITVVSADEKRGLGKPRKDHGERRRCALREDCERQNDDGDVLPCEGRRDCRVCVRRASHVGIRCEQGHLRENRCHDNDKLRARSASATAFAASGGLRTAKSHTCRRRFPGRTAPFSLHKPLRTAARECCATVRGLRNRVRKRRSRRVRGRTRCSTRIRRPDRSPS